MKQRTAHFSRIVSLAIACLALSCIDAKAGGPDFDLAVAAYDEGRFEDALRLMTPLAEAGEPLAEYKLALMIRQGKGIVADAQRALPWFRKSADQGVADAQAYMGAFYRRGDLVPKSYEQAMQWYLKAADQGYENAQYRIALMYLNGEGVPKNAIQAYEWSLVASTGGEPEPKRLSAKLEKSLSLKEIGDAKKQAAMMESKIGEKLQMAAEKTVPPAEQSAPTAVVETAHAAPIANPRTIDSGADEAARNARVEKPESAAQQGQNLAKQTAIESPLGTTESVVAAIRNDFLTGAASPKDLANGPLPQPLEQQAVSVAHIIEATCKLSFIETPSLNLDRAHLEPDVDKMAQESILVLVKANFTEKENTLTMKYGANRATELTTFALANNISVRDQYNQCSKDLDIFSRKIVMVHYGLLRT